MSPLAVAALAGIALLMLGWAACLLIAVTWATAALLRLAVDVARRLRARR